MRTTSDVKPNRIGIRINDGTKDKLFGLAKQQGVSVSEYIREVIDSVEHNNYSVEHTNNNVEQDGTIERLQEQITELQNDNATNQERISELEADVKAKQERIAELEFLNDADYVEQLKKRIEELQTEIAGMKFLTPEYRDEVENMAEMTCGVERFYKSILDKIENREMDFNENGFDLTDAEVVEALRNVEIREQLDDMRKGCDEKQVDRVKAMTRALKQGLIKVRSEIWGIRG